MVLYPYWLSMGACGVTFESIFNLPFGVQHERAVQNALEVIFVLFSTKLRAHHIWAVYQLS